MKLKLVHVHGVTDSLSITRWSMIYRLQKNISQLKSVVVMETKQCSCIVKKNSNLYDL